MSTNNSQRGHSPSESFIENQGNHFNIDQLLSAEIMTISQPPSSSSSSSSIQFNSTNMIANIQQHNNIIIRQHTQRGQQHQQEFQHRQQEQRRLRQEQHQQHQEQQRRRRERRQRRYEQWQERVNQRQQERYRRQREEQEHYEYLRRRSPTFDELMDEILEERQLEEYYLERMTPQERQEIWEQENLNELQGNPAPRPRGLPLDDTERYAEFLQNQLYWDKHDQTMRVYDMQNTDYQQECIRNEQLLMQQEAWEDMYLLHQQQLQ